MINILFEVHYNTSIAHFKLNKNIFNHFKVLIGNPIIWIVLSSIPFWADHHAATQIPWESKLYWPAKITWLGRMGMCWDELDNPYGIDLYNLYLKYIFYLYFTYISSTIVIPGLVKYRRSICQVYLSIGYLYCSYTLIKATCISQI